MFSCKNRKECVPITSTTEIALKPSRGSSEEGFLLKIEENRRFIVAQQPFWPEPLKKILKKESFSSASGFFSEIYSLF
jgi:hypothetical protein